MFQRKLRVHVLEAAGSSSNFRRRRMSAAPCRRIGLPLVVSSFANLVFATHVAGCSSSFHRFQDTDDLAAR